MLSIFILAVGISIFLNIKVTVRQGINYQWHIIRVPLYLKILDFYDRHFNYKELVKRIIRDSKNNSERVLRILKWTYQNIRETPEDFPVIDDHVWHIILRGYGVRDQYSDVFATLCNYAGMDAYFSWVYSRDQTARIPLAFVKIDGGWSVVDPYYGVYFKNKNGEIADLEEIRSTGSLFADSVGVEPDMDYTPYLDNFPSIKDIKLCRSNIQSPLNRLLFELKNWFR
jgi:hypothetical protein